MVASVWRGSRRVGRQKTATRRRGCEITSMLRPSAFISVSFLHIVPRRHKAEIKKSCRNVPTPASWHLVALVSQWVVRTDNLSTSIFAKTLMAVGRGFGTTRLSAKPTCNHCLAPTDELTNRRLQFPPASLHSLKA